MFDAAALDEAPGFAAVTEPPLIPANAGTQDRRFVVIHLTPHAPRIPADARINDPCRWMRLGGPTPAQAVQKLLDRLDLHAHLVRFRANAQGEVEAASRWNPDEPLALIVEGLTEREAADAAETLARSLRQ